MQKSSLKKINPNELRKLKTYITQFMVDRSLNNKTFDELVTIFNGCYQGFNPDPSNDLRICCYVMDMTEKRWDDKIILELQNGEIKDGVHRGIAYLKCINNGVNENNLPKIFIKEI